MDIVLTILLWLYVAAAAAYWAVAAWAMWRMGSSVVLLSRAEPPEPPRWPRLSIIVPGCNEGDKMEAAARTLLAQDYPNLQIVLVDDRSSDETGSIVDRLAGEDCRVVAIHVTELPDGWLGKVHAMSRGLAIADGELVLFTDADVHFRPGTLRKAVAHFEARGLDHLTALPGLWPSSAMLDGLIAGFIRQLMMLARPWKVADPSSRRFMGVGAFNLVRRNALQEAGGLDWLRMEVADDMAIGMMMKHAGRKCEVVNAAGLLEMHWYQTCGQAMRCSERGWATPGDFHTAGMIVGAAVIAMLEASPVVMPALLAVALILPAGAAGLAAAAAGLAVTAAFLVAAGMMTRWSGGRILPPLLAPLLAGFAFFATVRAAVLGLVRGGIIWRGTLYTTDALRQGRRVRFF
jgi:hypothetical protein